MSDTDYSIKTAKRTNENHKTMIIVNGAGNEVAEYKLTVGRERAEVAQMRRQLNKHLTTPGATLGNYQF